MNIKDIENAWKLQKGLSAESPEEIVEDAVEMAKGNLMSLKRHLDGLMSMYSKDNMCFAESWVQGKLNLADDYIKAVHDYVASETDDEDEEEDSQEISMGKNK